MELSVPSKNINMIQITDYKCFENDSKLAFNICKIMQYKHINKMREETFLKLLCVKYVYETSQYSQIYEIKEEKCLPPLCKYVFN